MSALATFGICLAIAIVLLLILASTPIALLILIFPLLIAESITGERSMFAPNGGSGSKKSWLYQVIAALGFLVEAIIVAGIFYGVYGIFWGWPGAETITIVNKISLSASETSTIQIINKILLLVISYFSVMFTYNTLIVRKQIIAEKDFFYFIHNILPFIAFAFGFAYLIGCYLYLQAYPQKTQLGFIFVLSGVLYISYILYSWGRMIYYLKYAFRPDGTYSKPQFWYRTALSFSYYGLFIYFAYKVYIS